MLPPELKRPSIEPPTPAELIVSTAEELKAGVTKSYKTDFLTQAYHDWSEALANRFDYVRKFPLEEEIEKPFFNFFCAQLRVEGVEIPPREEAELLERLFQR